MSYKVALLIPYYGNWPNDYFNLFLDSCKNNKLLDIHFITDQNINRTIDNVKSIYMSINTIESLISDKLNINICLNNPYKLCDFKPTYGVLFGDYIKDYKYWAYGDIDLIFGNISKFISEKILLDNDIITFRTDHIHGPFTIIKNISSNNELYKSGVNYKEILKKDLYMSFDEFGSQGFKINKNLLEKNILEDNFSAICYNAFRRNELSLYMEDFSIEKIIDSKNVLIYNEGKIYDIETKKEYMFYHWVWEKRSLWFKYPTWIDNIPKRYYIADTGFYNESQYRFYFFISIKRKIVGTINWCFLKTINYIKRLIGKNVTIDTYPRVGFVKYI